MRHLIKKIEESIGNMKTGLVLLGIFIFVLVAGSILESYSNAQFVDRLIYSSNWFKCFLGLITLTILFSLMNKFPFRKKHLGFYLIHMALLIILAGGLLTSYTAIEGELILYPDRENDMLELSRHEIIVSKGRDIHELVPIQSIDLPFRAFSQDENQTVFKKLRLKRYLPFYTNQLTLGDEVSSNKYYSVILEIEKNKNLSTIALSNHPSSEVTSRAVFDGINLTLFPKNMQDCFMSISEFDFFMWDRNEQKCFYPEKDNIKVEISKNGNRAIEYSFKNLNYVFWPEISPRPMKEDQSVIEDAPIMVISKKVFQNEILLFDNTMIWWPMGSREEKVIHLSDKGSLISQLNLKIKIQQQDFYRPLINLPREVVPSDNEQSWPAILFEYNNVDKWVFVDTPMLFKSEGEIVKISLEKKKAWLPFKVGLEKFDMDLYPESQMPASYRSHIKYDRNHSYTISMNNPLDYRGFRLFQSSYFELNDGRYASVLSVSRDPGRFLKYLGSFLLLAGLSYYYWKKRIF